MKEKGSITERKGEVDRLHKGKYVNEFIKGHDRSGINISGFYVNEYTQLLREIMDLHVKKETKLNYM